MDVPVQTVVDALIKTHTGLCRPLRLLSRTVEVTYTGTPVGPFGPRPVCVLTV